MFAESSTFIEPATKRSPPAEIRSRVMRTLLTLSFPPKKQSQPAESPSPAVAPPTERAAATAFVLDTDRPDPRLIDCVTVSDEARRETPRTLTPLAR